MSPGYAPELAERRKERIAEAEESVARAAQALRTAGFKVTTRVGEGEVRSGILDVAAEWGAGLIVLGSHGRTGLQRMFPGKCGRGRGAPRRLLGPDSAPAFYELSAEGFLPLPASGRGSRHRDEAPFGDLPDGFHSSKSWILKLDSQEQ
jgi:hypothetical protein